MRPESSTSEVNLGSLEEGIKKILENHSGNPNAAANQDQAANDGLMEEMATQIERLKLQLMQKTEEVEQLKSGGAQLSTSPSAETATTSSAANTEAASKVASSDGGGAAELEEKIRDLEAKLSEYSIIEDDIADLSFYKEETVRLQSEVDKLKQKLAEYEASGPPPKFVAPPSPSITTNSTSASMNASPPSSPASSPQTTSSTPMPTPTATVAADPSSVDDDIMAEFERAVAEQKAASAASKATKELSPAAFSSAEASNGEVESPKTNSNDLEIVKMESPSPKADDSNAPLTELNQIDLDKMLSEVDSLPQPNIEEVPNALEQELDTEKLLQEATGMGTAGEDSIREDESELIKKEGA